MNFTAFSTKKFHTKFDNKEFDTKEFDLTKRIIHIYCPRSDDRLAKTFYSGRSDKKNLNKHVYCIRTSQLLGK